MKPLSKIVFALCTALLCAAVDSPAKAASPTLPIEEAVAIAQKSLKERGLDCHLAGTSLERERITSGTMHWVARWSRAIVRAERKKEIGLQIAMNGEVVRLIKAPPEGAGVKTNRASILDLRGH